MYSSQMILELHRCISLLIAILHDNRGVDRQPKLRTSVFRYRARTRDYNCAGRYLKRGVGGLAIKLIVYQIVDGSPSSQDRVGRKDNPLATDCAFINSAVPPYQPNGFDDARHHA